MTSTGASLAADVRRELLSEVRGFLPAHLGGAALSKRGPVTVAAELFHLAPADLRRVLTIHALQHEAVQAFVHELPLGVRRPVVATTRPKAIGRDVASSIDWAATMRLRATASPTGELWVTRPAQRIFDTPQNRALAWLVGELRRLSASVGAEASTAEWARSVRDTHRTAVSSIRAAWMETVPPQWPGNDVYRLLGTERTGFYRLRLADAAKYVRSIVLNPTADQVAAALCDLYFEPSRDWQLFEFAILLRLSRAFEAVATRRGHVGLLTSGAFAEYEAGDVHVKLWYQRWPVDSGASEAQDAIRHYGMTGGTRPDIIAEITKAGGLKQLVVLELKASSSETYLPSGLVQLLGYLRDRPKYTTEEASGWLVAPPSTIYESKDPGGRALWVVNSDEVASALVRRVNGLGGQPVGP